MSVSLPFCLFAQWLSFWLHQFVTQFVVFVGMERSDRWTIPTVRFLGCSWSCNHGSSHTGKAVPTDLKLKDGSVQDVLGSPTCDTSNERMKINAQQSMRWESACVTEVTALPYVWLARNEDKRTSAPQNNTPKNTSFYFHPPRCDASSN